jgi:hypothetical protein
LAVAWLCWLALVLLVIWNTDAPWFLRTGLSVLVVCSLPSLLRFVLLRGRRAVRAAEWNGQGEFQLSLGPGRSRISARLAGSQRLGPGLWTVHFLSPEGRFSLLVDTALQSVRPFRRLARALERGDLLPSRPKV